MVFDPNVYDLRWVSLPFGGDNRTAAEIGEGVIGINFNNRHLKSKMCTPIPTILKIQTCPIQLTSMAMSKLNKKTVQLLKKFKVRSSKQNSHNSLSRRNSSGYSLKNSDDRQPAVEQISLERQLAIVVDAVLKGMIPEIYSGLSLDRVG